MPADRSISAPHRPGIRSIASTAAATSSSSTSLRSAARETNASSRLGVAGPGGGRLGGEVAGHPRPPAGSGRQAVHPDAERARLEGERPGEAEHRRLRRRVRGAPGERALAGDRGDVDDVAATPPVHGGQERPAHQVDRPHVGAEDLVPLGRLDVDQRLDRAADPGVVDQQVDVVTARASRSASTDSGSATSAGATTARSAAGRLGAARWSGRPGLPGAARPSRPASPSSGRPGSPARRRRPGRSRSPGRARCPRR